MVHVLSHGLKSSSHEAMPRTEPHSQKQYFFVARGFPAAPGMPRAAPSVLGTVASGKNVWFMIVQRQFQRDSVVVLVGKKRKSLPPPPSETDRRGGRENSLCPDRYTKR